MADTAASEFGATILSIIGLVLTASGARNLEIPLIGNRPGRIYPIDINPFVIDRWQIPLSASLMGIGGGITYAGCQIYAKDKYKNDNSSTKDNKVQQLTQGLTETTVGSVLLGSNIIKMIYESRNGRNFAYTFEFLKSLGLVSITQISLLGALRPDVITVKYISGSGTGKELFYLPAIFGGIGLSLELLWYLFDINATRNVTNTEKALLLSGLAGSIMVIDGAIKIGES